MIFKLISFLVFLGLILYPSTSKHATGSNSPIPNDTRTDPNAFVLVNPNQVRRLERTIRNFFSKIAEPIDKPIVLRSTSSDSYGLLSTIRKFQQLNRHANGFKFLGVVNDAAEFSDRLSQCLVQITNNRKRRSSFSLNRAILDLMKHTPEITLKTLETSLRNISQTNVFKNHSRRKPWHIFFCLSTTSNRGIDYDECIRELQRFDECLSSSRQSSNMKMHNFDAKSWTRAIRSLSHCKTMEDKYGETEVSCKPDRRMPRKIKKKTKYVFERILDRKIPRGSSFHRAVNDLGDTFSESEWGQRFIDELCQYFGIYEDGKKKLSRFSKSASKNKKAALKRSEISEALKSYKKGAMVRTFGAINKMHRSAVDFEKFFAEGMRDTFKEAWQSHVKVLSSLMDWMTKLLELHSGGSTSGKEPRSSDTSSSDTSTSQVEWNSDEDLDSENMRERVVARPKSEIIKDVDSSMNSLMKSMNHLTRHRNATNKDMLTSLANNLLLVMIFMETMGFVSSLYCFGPIAREETSLEFNDEWNRQHGSLHFSKYDEIIDLISREYPLFYQNVKPFWDENN
ncbi:uncharacterized protein LOC110119488 isoform X2 [Bombus terrestris]|uniref:Uncharacterized protein LOC110119488 isoform X2 n=1 Tax=Bombus terrestris TaxID=30195 RepID=A0A9B7CW00_BOMTE|nr:uncharacterized protein LOC110119488 isoform X2 [Bombus terrestris]